MRNSAPLREKPLKNLETYHAETQIRFIDQLDQA